MTPDIQPSISARLRQTVWAGVLLLGASPAAWACPACVPLVEAGIYGENFIRHLLLMLIPVGVLVAIAVGVYRTGPPASKSKKGFE